MARWFAAISLVLSACAAGEEVSRPTYTRIPTTTTTTTTVVLASSTLQDQVEWVIERLIKANDVGIDEVEERFATTYLDEVTAEQLISSTRALSDDVLQWRTVQVAQTDQTRATALIEADKVPLNLTLTIDAAGQIEFLLLQPAAARRGSIQEVLDDLEAVGSTSLLVAEVREDRTCSILFRHNVDRANPVASTFKVYVLEALAAAIEKGEVGWNDPLPIHRSLQSSPFGPFADLVPGTEKTVRQHAEAMITMSDDTATDHLVDLVGRGAVETAMLDLGHSDPALNIPFPTTMEMKKLKLGLTDEERSGYFDSNPRERAAYLDTELDNIIIDQEALLEWDRPLHTNTLGWFATPGDICLALAALTMESADPARAPLRTVLSANPGVPQDPNVWPYVAFTGGSEPGVLSLAWYTERDDGRTFVVVANVTSTRPIPDTLAGNAAAILGLLKNYE